MTKPKNLTHIYTNKGKRKIHKTKKKSFIILNGKRKYIPLRKHTKSKYENL